ncbi:histidine phosphatase family protein [Sulfitobacter sp. BDSS02]|nr:histidine phosphatase family protein [Sulfitobacter sp. BDSS02]MBR9847987.1 histidine phosphatase family protein [Paracoccaceae bacterium]
MTRLFLVRHGPTHAKSMVGWSDLPADLSDLAQIDRLSGYLPSDALVVSSDLLRSTATADAIQGSRQRLNHRPELREIHFGQWELRSAAEIEAEDAALARAYWETPGDIRPPGGESWNDARARIDPGIDRLIAKHTGRDLVVVVHFGVILTQLQRAHDISAYEVLGQRIDNLSVTEISLRDGQWSVGAINHLP